MENLPLKKIIDVSWRFGVTVASSGTDKIGTNFMHLKILYDEEGQTKSIFIEMSLAQFYKFLHDLEKAKRSLDILT
ncbi:COMM domain-containing protein 7-like [Copidosoma floridanum]|uniref:COMM domain-containing protein 7-like n=1 Tax=Copidosoma floridanum TaxID=29053 RepID=UPI000C6F7A78|nr:COMM domain-containing protein 7-like [Copidosoma floridanum]